MSKKWYPKYHKNGRPTNQMIHSITGELRSMDKRELKRYYEGRL